tara:strand:- start:13052 stop:13723 length:672 start_codon:yes stop_codon:yes gene_type:complete
MLRVLLASKSERRFQWLDQNLSSLGVRIESRTLVASEISAPQGLEVRKQVEMICRDKARNASIEQSVSESGDGPKYDVILVSDTMIEDPDDSRLSIGKPNDNLVAASILMRLSGRRHKVWTSTSILFPPGNEKKGDVIEGGWIERNYTSSATVEFSDLNHYSMEELVSSESWKGKAGGYDLAGIAGKYCHLIEGEEVTVLGISDESIEFLKSILSNESYASKL